LYGCIKTINILVKRFALQVPVSPVLLPRITLTDPFHDHLCNYYNVGGDPGQQQRQRSRSIGVVENPGFNDERDSNLRRRRAKTPSPKRSTRIVASNVVKAKTPSPRSLSPKYYQRRASNTSVLSSSSSEADLGGSRKGSTAWKVYITL